MCAADENIGACTGKSCTRASTGSTSTRSAKMRMTCRVVLRSCEPAYVTEEYPNSPPSEDEA
ncbi:hypothetical protein PsYK624_093110 [Phanerochaete sordida]|uniref:Uncharacterized protein n=1 Tax=Phanerochaete sordida TaxID=48140 RepID=A0A9P3GE86_9APHY|nr:hypothetical protein PsYK624_093110 [Phanerochaete sordida]